MSCLRMLAALCLMLSAALAVAQPLPGSEVASEDPLDRMRRMAAARSEAEHAEAKDLAAQKVAAAQVAFESRFNEYLAGRGTLDWVLEAANHWLDAASAASGSPQAEALVAEKRWEAAWAAQVITEARVAAWAKGTGDLALARRARLDAELSWARARQARRPGRVPDLGDPLSREMDGVPLWEEMRALAEAKFAAEQSDPATLRRSRADAARYGARARVQEYLAGRATLDVALYAALDAAEAIARVSRDDIDPAVVAAARWEVALLAEEVTAARHRNGTAGIADLAQVRAARLRAELTWLRARGAGRPRDGDPVSLWHDLGDLGEDFARVVARAREEAEGRQPADVARQYRETARLLYQARQAEFLAGRATQDLVLQATVVLRDADLSVASSRAERLAAHEAAWERLWLLEQVTEHRSRRGTISSGDAALAQYARLDAELLWRRARTEATAP